MIILTDAIFDVNDEYTSLRSNYWVKEGCFDVINVSVNRASTISSLTHLKSKGSIVTLLQSE